MRASGARALLGPLGGRRRSTAWDSDVTPLPLRAAPAGFYRMELGKLTSFVGAPLAWQACGPSVCP